jgi:hypothetical protein
MAHIHKFIKTPDPPSKLPVVVLWYPAENLKNPAQRISDLCVIINGRYLPKRIWLLTLIAINCCVTI